MEQTCLAGGGATTLGYLRSRRSLPQSMPEAIVATVMQLHAGRVEVSSGADGETRFALHFPL